MNKFGIIKLLLIFIVFYALLILFFGIYEFKDLIIKIPYTWWIASTIIPILSHSILSVRWYFLIRYLSFRIKFIESFKIYIAGLSLIAAPARSGEAIRSIWLNPYKIETNVGIGITISERITDLSSASLLIIWSLTNNQYIYLMILFLFILIYSLRNNFIYLLKFIIKIISLIFKNKSTIIFKKQVYKSLSYVKYLSNPIPFILSNILCSFAWLLEAFLLYITFKYLNVELTFQQSTLIRTAMAIGGVISFLPGGLLTSESTSIAISIAYGTGKAEAFAATLFLRFYTLFIPTIFGLTALVSQKDINSSIKTIK